MRGKSCRVLPPPKGRLNSSNILSALDTKMYLGLPATSTKLFLERSALFTKLYLELPTLITKCNYCCEPLVQKCSLQEGTGGLSALDTRRYLRLAALVTEIYQGLATLVTRRYCGAVSHSYKKVPEACSLRDKNVPWAGN